MGQMGALVWVLVALVSFTVSQALVKFLIPILQRLKAGQSIREAGPAWHKQKEGTPTMGGIGIIAAFLVTALVAILLCQTLFSRIAVVWEADSSADVTRLFAGMVMAVLFGAIGFLDDFIKVVKKRNLGLTSRQKLLAQIAVAAAYAVAVYIADGDRIHIPFVGEWDAGLWYIPIAVFIIVAVVNATNLTDGIDGLCGSVSVVVSLFLLALCGKAVGYGILSAALAGSLAGFLVWNFHPAKVFMGDTGSLFIGGALCAVAFGLGHPFLLLPMGIVYFCETLSVILQVTYFKKTGGKRLFKMTPIHHHFEMCGWKENKIVAVFSAVAAIGCIVGVVFFALS